MLALDDDLGLENIQLDGCMDEMGGLVTLLTLHDNFKFENTRLDGCMDEMRGLATH